MPHQRKIAVIGLGYVGLPVAVAFARSGAAVTGFDIESGRIEELCAGIDRTLEVEKTDLLHPTLSFTADPAALATPSPLFLAAQEHFDEVKSRI